MSLNKDTLDVQSVYRLDPLDYGASENLSAPQAAKYAATTASPDMR